MATSSLPKLFPARLARGASPTLRKRRRLFYATQAFRAQRRGDTKMARAYVSFALNNGARLADLARAGRDAAPDDGARDAWLKLLQDSPQFSERSVNEGFSGGEKKRHEILQLGLLKPKIAILDETDSGLDVDALRVVSEGVNRYAEAEQAGVLLITHYTRILRYIHPQFVHVFVDGRIVASGGPELADELEENGYVRFTERTTAAY
jgi:Fe-S cluster assembly ATPase SufC